MLKEVDQAAAAADKIKTLLDKLRYGTIVKAIAVLLIIVFAIGFWENRPIIYAAMSVGRFSTEVIPRDLSIATQSTISQIVERHRNIVAIQVVTTSFRENVRQGVHMYSKYPQINSEYTAFHKNKTNETALFAQGDAAGNDRLIRIIEQELVCVGIPNRTQSALPLLSSTATQVCSLSVPPRYGKMVGYINVWLLKPIGPSEMPEYKQIARAVADEIYDRDVTKVIK